MRQKPVFKWILLSALKPFPRNSRTHSDSQIQQIVQSINEYGFTNPILVDENNTIIAGHGRLLAANKIGLTEVPCIVLADLTAKQKQAYIIADNKLALNAGWDVATLIEELDDLKSQGFDLDLTGFSPDEINDLTPQVISVGLIDDDEIPNSVQTIVKLGDIWLLGNHRLMCGDSTIIDDVEKLMNGEKADMVFTDPPYGVEYQSNRRTKSSQFEILKNDDVILDVAPNIFLILNENSSAFIWTSHTVYPQWRSQFNEYYKNTIIWYKGCGGMGDLSGNYATDYEMAIFCVKGKIKFNDSRGMAVWDIKKDSNSSYEHPTQKPVALGDKAITELTKNGGLVADIFGGSGSTLIACEKTNRKCFMMELSPAYCDVIIARWEKFTGKKAIRDNHA
jgi:DNA modification methylase